MLTMRAPRALLLDFGGVVASVVDRPGWSQDMAVEVRALLSDAAPLTVADIAADVLAADVANTAWKSAMSRTAAPRELTAVEFWSEFVACDWPAECRRAVTRHAAELCYRMGVLRSSRTVRAGIVDLLRAATGQGVAVAVVSNAMSGLVHREFVTEHGLGPLISVQVYSDEVGFRKPNPRIVRLAADALGIDVRDTWFVGDTPDRDIRGARRAGVGATVLMHRDATDVAPDGIPCEPDAVVAGPAELTEILRSACRRAGVAR